MGLGGIGLYGIRATSLVGVGRDLRAHVQAGVVSLETSLCTWSLAGWEEGRREPQISMLVWWAAESGLNFEWARIWGLWKHTVLDQHTCHDSEG